MRDRVETLERLHRLHADGALTSEEFEAEKRRLLGEPEQPILPPSKPHKQWVVAAATAAGVIVIAGAAWLASNAGSEQQPVSTPHQTQVPAPAASDQEPEPQRGIRSLNPAEQLSAAFAAAFGRRGSAVRTVDGDRLTYTPTAIHWIGNKAALISTATNALDCHACTGAISVHYLRPFGMGFQVERAWLRAAGSGDWGDPTDDMAISTRFSPYPVIVTQDGFTGQGYTCRGVQMVELRPEGPSKWDYIPAVYSDVGNKGAVEGVEIKGTITNVQKDRSFSVVYTGADSFSESYVRRGAKFVRTVASSQLPSC